MKMQTASRNLKRKKILGEKDEAEEELKYLEKVILGDGTEIFEKEDAVEDLEEAQKIPSKTPAWVDEDDSVEQGSQYEHKIYGKKVDQKFREYKFLKAAKKPKWAKYSMPEKEQDSILKKCGNLITKSKALESGVIEIKKVKDINSQTYNEGPITTVKFHRKSTVALVTGLSGVASLFQVDGKENPKLQSIKLHKFPISCANFVNNDEELMFASKSRRYFRTYNLMTGQNYSINHGKIDGLEGINRFTVSPDDKIIAVSGKRGKIYLLSAKTKECIDNLQMNDSVNCITFSSDGSRMFSFSGDGEVYVWDMKSRLCIQKFTDEGCLSGTAIDVSSNNAYLACGSNTGVVNVYNLESVMLNKIQPLKTFYNLVTPITGIKFNPTSELLSAASFHKENAIKLIHLSSMTVFSNFPVSQSQLHRIECIDFSPNSGYLGLGDSWKTAHLFRLKYYGNY